MSQEWKEPAVGDDVQMPLGTGEAAPAEDYTPPKARMNTSTVALVAAFAAALVVLYFLGLQNKPRPASAEAIIRAQETDARIKAWTENKAGQKAVNGLLTEGERLIGVLKAHFEEKLSAIDLTGNPFERVLAKVVPPPPPPPGGETTTKPSDPGEDPLVVKEWLDVAKDFGGLKLQMIILGRPTAALVNNQMVAVGTRFKYLTVTDIQADRVILGYKDKTFELKVGGPSKP